MEGPLRREIKGLSVKWLKLSSSLWGLAVRPARRRVTRECIVGFLTSLEWFEKREIGPEEFTHIFSEWILGSESHKGGEPFKNEFTLAHLRTVLLEDKRCYSEQKISSWIRLLTKEFYRRIHHKPICYNRGDSGVGAKDVNTSSSSSSNKKSAPTNPSSLEVVTEEWSRLCKEIFSMLDINKNYHWTFEEVLFFTSILSVAKARFQAEDQAEAEEFVSATLALDKLSTRALNLQRAMGATFQVTSGALVRTKKMGIGKAPTPSKKEANAPPATSYVTEPMFANFLLKKQIGAAALKSLVSLLKLVLKELRKLVSKEECGFDGLLPEELPALWHRSVTIASGFMLEKEPGYAKHCQQPESSSKPAEKPGREKDREKAVEETAAEKQDEESHQDDGDEDQSLLSSVQGGLGVKELPRKSSLRDLRLRGTGNGVPASPLLGISLFLITDACRMIPASLHAIDDGLHDLAFANDPADRVDRSEAERQCAEEMRKTAHRMIAAYNSWGELGTAMPMVGTLRGGHHGGKHSSRNTPGLGLSSTPVKAPKSTAVTPVPAESPHNAVLSLYLGVLVEYKNLHLQLCDALVHLHDVLWSKIANHPERYPRLECLEVLMPDSAGEDILREITLLYQPPQSTPEPDPDSVPDSTPAKPAAAEVGTAPPKARRTREQAAASRKLELEAKAAAAREAEEEELETRREEQRRRQKARRAAQERARLVRAQGQALEISTPDTTASTPVRSHEPQPQPRHQPQPQHHHVKQPAKTKHGHSLSDEKVPPRGYQGRDTLAEQPAVRRDQDPDHIFFLLRSADSLEEKEALLAQLKAARYGDDGGGKGVDSAIGYYDHSPNPAQRQLLLSGSDEVADNIILGDTRRRASTATVPRAALEPLSLALPPSDDIREAQGAAMPLVTPLQKTEGRSSPMGSTASQSAFPVSPLTPDRDTPPYNAAKAQGQMQAPATSINDMLERGIDFDGAKYAKELRQRLRAMNSESGVTKQEARQLLEASQRAVESAGKGRNGGGGGGEGGGGDSNGGGDTGRGAQVTTVVSGTPTRRVPGLASTKKKNAKLPAAAELM